MDYKNNGFQNENTIIYGHNMRDTSMFGPLKKYKNLEYLKNNKYISIITKENKELTYKIFSVYITNSNDTYSISVKFNNQDEFSKYIREICKKSIYNLDEDIKNTDKILALATCSYEFPYSINIKSPAQEISISIFIF
ncbi:class B sortase [Clostridium perfringens]|uniref:class B sortase n=1 Tax=Clostridium perfringens TaxID=1502 RepID=UPI0013E38117|nr:class B sortase [Clostridium perfringens]NGT58525.1 class B sortase [Clostridium perfringens]